ncbi:MAG TPA: NAD(P)H-dependent glycerol-3-phosphate dehydrogenase [SAR86 cluster bacterium]|jgi:glycerol-3-phosphate dehydrogenase (NAD(P)+)|nr:NAD(P)H-dependent glycerol-3-phosphate dehydrogenase [SAR86 cluster bacterium]HJM14850.1 NAD(P)H-dependent glycerol-3-phosphate dehydrogenase [SAR86 cluster bacterium]
MNSKNISVLGGGSWGTVLANLAASNQHNVTLWMRDSEVVEEVNKSKRNFKYLPELKLEGNINATEDISLINNSEMVIFCIPSDSFREVSKKASEYINNSVQLVTATKGVEKDKFNLMSQVLNEHMKNNSVGILSGPNLAQEIATKQLSGTVIASEDKALQKNVVDILGSDFFRVYENDDPFGVEMGGAIKNIYAIACGVADGLNSGENTVGMIMTRGLGEMSRLAVELGANPQTFLGLSGVGDLITTCASPLSRNHKFGKYIGEGLSVENATEEIGQTVEGLKTLKVVKVLSDERNINMPIVDSLYKIIYKGENLNGSVQNILGEDLIKDVEFFK